ncbi:ATP synthase F1 subunit epsilon [Facklamia miroungae]|uniref:ATP synthase epsilon chain n=1 Tax=Facklamia miroungae TaxID=120956 RepID=A0A1G7PFB2_9LACT|nr:ATP synthase F1 subunit epsilon [Facklamia miroungae]NKZ28693.1 ATP synthase F1 subunit epsilon [Facklamia miroungae]SDF84945.1 F-type H+-transporting ATPase subunit epsilon [Facklamia miroungae]
MTQTLKNLQVQIISPNGVVYTKRARKCHVQTVNGGITILPNHIAMMTVLDISTVVVTPLKEAKPDDYIAINGGLLEIRDNELNIIANMAVRALDIDDAKTKMELSLAEDKMKQAQINQDIRAYHSAEIELRKALNQLDAFKHQHNQ